MKGRDDEVAPEAESKGPESLNAEAGEGFGPEAGSVTSQSKSDGSMCAAGPGQFRKSGRKTKDLQADLAVMSDRLLRLQADFENYRKRMSREKDDLYCRANEDIMVELLSVLDHLDLALGAVEAHERQSAFVEGFRLVSDQLLAVLGKFGLVPIDAKGEVFDPNRHEAVSHLPSNKIPENTVIEQTRRGYMLGDRLLRAAQVVVSSGSPVSEAAGSVAETG